MRYDRNLGFSFSFPFLFKGKQSEQVYNYAFSHMDFFMLNRGNIVYIMTMKAELTDRHVQTMLSIIT